MINNFFTSIVFLFFSFSTPVKSNIAALPLKAGTEATALSAAETVYNSIDADSYSMPELSCFTKAFAGFSKLKEDGKIKKDYLTVIDFSKSSNSKRLWIIDMKNNKVLYNTLVAHGRNSGNEFATSFSNQSSSNKSSLGFYATGEIYQGKHGASLRLDGLERGINNNARARAVVMHAADYVSEKFIQMHSRLGRSLGCPALPNNLNREIINLIQGKSCLFIYHPTKEYIKASKLI